MKDQEIISQELLKKLVDSNSITINDIREKEFKEVSLSENEKLALYNFDKFRLFVLNQQDSEEIFHKKYMQLQALANLSPYEEFLKEKYVISDN